MTYSPPCQSTRAQICKKIAIFPNSTTSPTCSGTWALTALTPTETALWIKLMASRVVLFLNAKSFSLRRLCSAKRRRLNYTKGKKNEQGPIPGPGGFSVWHTASPLLPLLLLTMSFFLGVFFVGYLVCVSHGWWGLAWFGWVNGVLRRAFFHGMLGIAHLCVFRYWNLNSTDRWVVYHAEHTYTRERERKEEE